MELPVLKCCVTETKLTSCFSRTPMIYRRVEEDYIARHDSKHRLRCYGLDLSGVENKEIKPVVLEGSL